MVSSLLADMDLKDPETLASISNSMIRPPVPFPVKKLYRGEPMALGITQILIGILEISFGLVVAIAESPREYHIIEDHFFTPYWMGFLYIISSSLSVAAAKHPKVPLYIISGSLSVAAAKDPKVPLVKGMLAMNVVSSVAAGIAILIFSISIAHGLNHLCQHEVEYYNTTSTDICQEHVLISYNMTYAVSAILLAVTVLEFLITITTACFGCASLCRNDYSETTVVVFQKTEEGITPASALPRHTNEDVEA